MPARSIETPLGTVTAIEDDGAIIRLEWSSGQTDDTDLLRIVETQLGEYFAGTRDAFVLPIRINASAAQQAVCAAMQAIPMGETRTYGDLARDLKLSAQAVGQLCGGNPIPIIVPCHRILGATTLGGFSAPGGVEAKIWLLKHEKAGGLLI
jgi:methylated-DNA-[protein]-cysteine S-methyltransferase